MSTSLDIVRTNENLVFFKCQHIWAIAMILMNDPLGQSWRAQISSTCFIYNQVIIQKSVFRILHDYFIFLAMSFGDCNARYSENPWLSVFFSYAQYYQGFLYLSILIYSRRGSMYAPSVILQQTLCQGLLMPCGALYFSTMDFYGFHQLGFAVLLNNSPSQLT